MVNAAIFPFISRERHLTTVQRGDENFQIKKDGAQLQNITPESGDTANKTQKFNKNNI